jgi:hypothetical protein
MSTKRTAALAEFKALITEAHQRAGRSRQQLASLSPEDAEQLIDVGGMIATAEKSLSDILRAVAATEETNKH